MSVTIEMSESKLRIAMFKIALSLTGLVVIIGLIVSVLADRFPRIAINTFFVCMTFWFLCNAALALLHIVDWFEARRAKRNA